MTRKEAVANLNMISVAFVEPVTKEQRKLIDDTFGMAINALEQLTSYEQTINKLTKAISEQETRKGHWKRVVTEVSDLGDETWHYECSECGACSIAWGDDRFCHHCGARMEGES